MRRAATVLTLGFWLLTLPLRAEDAPLDAKEAPPEQQAANALSLEELAQENAAQQQTLEALQRRVDELTQQQAAEQEPAASAIPGLRKLRLFGFTDFLFTHSVIERGSLMELYGYPGGSFSQTSLNLYLASELTERLRMLAELRFSFLPNGQESLAKTAVVALVNGQQVPMSGTAYERGDTTYTQPFMGMRYRYGSVGIERLQMSYLFADWLQLVAGRFFTPVGIWNEDHGSTVLLTTRLPHFLWEQMFPLSQTGLMLKGRFFFLQSAYLDYALTLSNGRGPMDSLADLDNNKGAGFRLKATLEKSRFSVSVGASGYLGAYRDIKRTLIVDTDTGHFGSSRETTEAYDERDLALDLRLDLWGFRLQSEAIFRDQRYTLPPTANGGVQDPSQSRTAYMSSFIGRSFYVLLGYELPLSRYLGQVEIMPYLVFDWHDPMDNDPTYENQSLFGGLNIRPLPDLVVKLEVSHLWMDVMLTSQSSWSTTAQAALSF